MRRQLPNLDHSPQPFLLGLPSLSVWISVCCLVVVGVWQAGIIWSGESRSASPVYDESAIYAPRLYTPDPQQFSHLTANQIIACESISVRLAYGGIWGGYEWLDCDSSGECEYFYQDLDRDLDVVQWRILQHQFTPTELRLIRKAIVSLGLLQLHKSYSSGATDGAAKYVLIETPWGDKKIRCDNCHVHEVEMFWTLLHTMIQSTRTQDLRQAQIVDTERMPIWVWKWNQ